MDRITLAGYRVRGSADVFTSGAPTVAVIGARDCTAYGAEMASQIAHDLAQAGAVVYSGGAFGIDAAAHRGALAAGGRTVAVLPCGLNNLYPVAHKALFERIAETGALLSPFMDDALPSKAFFLERNRVLVRMVRAVVVVEGRGLSGSGQAARYAMDYGTPVFAVPGPVTSQQSSLPHALIRDGAQLVTSAADVLGVLA